MVGGTGKAASLPKDVVDEIVQVRRRSFSRIGLTAIYGGGFEGFCGGCWRVV